MDPGPNLVVKTYYTNVNLYDDAIAWITCYWLSRERCNIATPLNGTSESGRGFLNSSLPPQEELLQLCSALELHIKRRVCDARCLYRSQVGMLYVCRKSSNNGRGLHLLSCKEHQAFVGGRLILEAGLYFLKLNSWT